MNKEEILAAVIDKTPEEIQQWFVSLEDNDFIEATEILEQMAKELPVYQNNEEFKKEVDGIAVSKETFEDLCNKEAVQQLKNEMALDESFQKLDNEFHNLKEGMIDTLLNNPDQEELLTMIREMIQIEKDHDHYNPKDWEAISHLL